MMRTPHLPGVVTADDLELTAATIAALQLADGMIEWFPGGHTDPWNHIEAAMALTTCGRVDEAVGAYDWLRRIQHDDGGWHNYYVADAVDDPKVDSNCVAYVATGVWHLWLATRDRGLVERYWPMVERATEFVLGLQTPRGEIVWARRPDGTPWDYALLTGSSSISHSLACAVSLAQVVGVDRPEWALARSRLVDVIRHHPGVFAPKDRWAMDWYYPVLVGAVTGDDAVKMLLDRWDVFVMEGHGVRCVSDQPWVTAAETCECAMAHLACGERQKAEQLFEWAQALRAPEGGYFTGEVHPQRVNFPEQERSAYTAAAVILAADALCGANPTSDVLVDPPGPASVPRDASSRTA